MPVSLYGSGGGGIVRFTFDPSSGLGPDQVFAFETPVESLIKIMENAEIARRLEQEAQRANPSGSRRTTALQWLLAF